MRNWLGGRDSNPDTVVQSHVSYRWTTSQYQQTRAVRHELLIIPNQKAERQHAVGWPDTVSYASYPAALATVKGLCEGRALARVRGGVTHTVIARVAVTVA